MTTTTTSLTPAAQGFLELLRTGEVTRDELRKRAAAGKISREDVDAATDALADERIAAAASAPAAGSAIDVYRSPATGIYCLRVGDPRRPVTLYPQNLIEILANAREILGMLRDDRGALAKDGKHETIVRLATDADAALAGTKPLPATARKVRFVVKAEKE